MSETVRNVGVVYGNRGEIFDAGGKVTLEAFVEQTFGITNIFENKLVMGRCICHGKKDLETDVLLCNQKDAEGFMLSKESTKPHVVLIYNKPTDWQNSEAPQPKSESQSSSNDVVVSAKQWEELVGSVKELKLSVDAQRTMADSNRRPVVVHEGITCNSCYPETGNEPTSKSIVGPRFKCFDCVDFDLCSSCEARGVEINSHRRHHNMAKINTPLKRGAKLNATGLSACKANDKEIASAGASENKRDIFSALSNVDALYEVLSGYKAYCAQRAATTIPVRKPKSRLESSLEIMITRRDNLLTFNIYNNGASSLPGGCTLYLSAYDPSGNSESRESYTVEGYLGPHPLRPGNRKLFHRQFSHYLSKECVRIDILSGKKGQEGILFTGLSGRLLDTKIKLKQVRSLASVSSSGTGTPSSLATTDVQDDHYKPLGQTITREDEGVMSSSTNNDEYSLCSESDNETNWEDYDFLSEEDL